jgi:hypothetical protein
MDYVKLSTPVGPIYLKATGSGNDHVYVTSHENSHHEDWERWTVRGVPHHGSIHFFNHDLGDNVALWLPKPPKYGEPSEVYRSNDMYVHNSNKIGIDGTMPARKAILAAIAPVVNEWCDKNRAALNQARREYLSDQIAELENKIADLDKQASDKRQEIVDLAVEITRLADET